MCKYRLALYFNKTRMRRLAVSFEYLQQDNQHSKCSRIRNVFTSQKHDRVAFTQTTLSPLSPSVFAVVAWLIFQFNPFETFAGVPLLVLAKFREK